MGRFMPMAARCRMPAAEAPLAAAQRMSWDSRADVDLDQRLAALDGVVGMAQAGRSRLCRRSSLTEAMVSKSASKLTSNALWCRATAATRRSRLRTV